MTNTTNTTAINYSKKVDLYQANKTMSVRVADYMNKKVWGIALKTRYRQTIDQLTQSIEAQEKLRGSIFGDECDTLITTMTAQIEQTKKKLAEELEKDATFTWDDNDKKFYKAYEKATTQAQVYRAVQCWFEAYGLFTDDANFIHDLMATFAGSKKASNKTIIRSEATQFTEDKRSKGDVLALFYGRLAEIMLEKGTLKPAAIPEDIREFYAPKKKASKKSNKNQEQQ